jgi:hypothetical protein
MTADFETELNEFNKLLKPISEHEENLRKLNLGYEDLLRITACSFAQCEVAEAEYDELKILLDEYEKVLTVVRLRSEKNNGELGDELLALFAEQNNQIAKSLISAAKFEKTRQARSAALARHTETYALKKQAIEYWHEHIDPNLSNPKAADVLIKVVPVSHRKLVEYVAEAKRENIPPAS